MSTIDISLIIATRNRANLLVDLLPQLEAARAATRSAAEVLIVDNDSTDDTRNLLAAWAASAPGRRHLTESRPNKALALNRALKEATGSVIAFTDDDVQVPPTWLDSVWQFFTGHQEYAAAVGRVRVPPGTTADVLAQIRKYPITQPLFDRGDAVIDAPEIFGVNMAIRRVVFDRVGEFDSRLGPGGTGQYEDTELGQRIQNAGLRLGYMPEATLYHLVDPTRISAAGFRLFHVHVARSMHVLEPNKANIGCAAKWLEAALSRIIWRLRNNRDLELKAWGRMIRHAELLRLRLAPRVALPRTQ